MAHVYITPSSVAAGLTDTIGYFGVDRASLFLMSSDVR